MENYISINVLNNGIKKDYPAGTTLKEVLEDQFPNTELPFLAALVNNRDRSLSYPLYFPKQVKFVDASMPTGQRAYRNSLSFVLYKAVSELYPKAELRIEHAISGGYYCYIIDENLNNKTIVVPLKARMQEIIDADFPFEYFYEETEMVIKKFEAVGLCDKVMLLQAKGDLYTGYYALDNTIDSFYSCMVPSSGYLKHFDLQVYHKGLLLTSPLKDTPSQLPPLLKQPKLLDVFSEFAGWNRTLKVSNIADINTKSKGDNIYDLIMLAEALQEKKVVKIVEMITACAGVRMILVSGPSSSGKTTFSKRLALQLQLAGLKPINISLDDYYVDRENSPRDENGEYDYEHIEALNIPLLNSQLQGLLDGEQVFLPKYSFKEGKGYLSETPTQLHNDEVLVVEGIHALNPQLTRLISEDVKFKIYVSALTTISLDNHNHIPTSDNRLLRRIIRDYNYRGTSAEENILRWPSVRKGEDKWIYPYQEEANVMFNSSLIFEFPVLKPFAEPILKEVKNFSEAHAEARRLLKFLSYFNSVDSREIPPTSLLREFLGGSSFRY